MNASDANTSVQNQGGNAGLSTEKKQVALRAARQAEDLAIELETPLAGRQNMDLRQFHQMMRGRYRLAVILLLIGAIAGTAIGFKCGKKVYASKGMIEIKAVLPKVLYPDDDKGALPMFDSYVESQAAWIRSQEVVNQAMLDDKWQAVRPGTSDVATEEFSKELTITHEGQIIYVQVVDPDATVAETAVKTLISAYETLYKQQDLDSDGKRIEYLQARLQALTSELQVKRDRILEIAKIYGSDDLRALFLFKQEQVNKVEASIREKQMLLTMTAQDASSTRPAEFAPTIEALASLNPQLAQLLQEGRTYDQQIALYTAENLGPQHHLMREAQQLKKLNEQEVAELVDRLQKEGVSSSTAVTASGALVNPAHLNEELASLRTLRKEWDDDKLEIGRRMLEIERLRGEATEKQAERDETEHRIDRLQVEETLNARILVLSHGDTPPSPYRNTQIPFSAAGGFGGGILGFGLVAMVALMDRRLRSPIQADGARFSAPILGVLPRLPDDLLDPVDASMAAHCVHEIRTLVQIWSRQSMHRAFAITSPHAGAGKTSLTLALGASYAAANLRTLIVDCDLVAGGLSRRLDAAIPRNFGEILIREGLVNAEQMIHTEKFVGPDAQTQGDMLVRWNVISAEQVERVLEMTLEEPVGILDAMHGMPVLRCTMETGINNLQIMPVGSATARDVPLLSPEAMHRLIESLRREFDVVLVDTGPILGSLEASLVAGAVDGVVLTVAKGDQRAMVDRAMSQLVTVGARVAGMVFNGATIEELIAYGRGSSVRHSGSSDRILPVDSDATVVPRRYGPLAAAVASSAPIQRSNSTMSSK